RAIRSRSSQTARAARAWIPGRCAWFSSRRAGGRRARSGRVTADADRCLAQQTQYDVAAVVLLDQHVLAALRIGTLHGKNAGHAGCVRHRRPSRWERLSGLFSGPEVQGPPSTAMKNNLLWW